MVYKNHGFCRVCVDPGKRVPGPQVYQQPLGRYVQGECLSLLPGATQSRLVGATESELCVAGAFPV